jgi:DHA1 family bicyclomycin/chloramphenicol resistance-like MFS transporter
VNAPHPAAPATRAARAGLLVLLGTLTAVGPLSLDMYLPAFPAMTGALDATPAEVQLSLTTFLFGLALGQLVTGPLSDRWGRRRPVLVGVAAYTAGSLLCALAPSAGALAALRLAQGVASGMGVVVARAIVRDLYSGAAAARYFSRLILIFGVAPIAAPALGTLVLRFGSWRIVFVTLTAIGVLLLAAVAWGLPETLPAGRRVADGPGAAVRAMAGLLTDRIYLGYVLTQGLAFTALFAYISGSSFVLQDVFAVSAGWFSLIFGLNAAGMTALGQLNARLLDRFTTRRLLTVGLFVGLLAATGLLAGSAAGSLPAVTIALFVFVSSIGMTLPNGLALALDRHPRRAGTAAALLGALQQAIASAIAPLAAIGPDHSALPMAVVMLGATALSAVAVLTLTRGAARAVDPTGPPVPQPVPTASRTPGR